MRMPGWFAAIVLVCIVPGAAAQRTADFRAVAEPAAIMYDAPTLRGKKLFVAPRGMPVEVVVSIEGWVKVRDRAGDMAWLERKAVTERRTVVAIGVTRLLERAEEGAKPVLEVAADVILDLEAAPPAPPGWVRVRHRDGATGFVRASQVWGL